jgi:hypothetical protein
LYEIAADNSGFVQLVEFVADSPMPPEQPSFVASHRQSLWFTLMELPAKTIAFEIRAQESACPRYSLKIEMLKSQALQPDLDCRRRLMDCPQR